MACELTDAGHSPPHKSKVFMVKQYRKDSMKRETIIALTLIVVVVIVFAGYQAMVSTSSETKEKTVRAGSKVQVDYIGMLEPKYNNLVFDTSMYSVAVDNITYPKVATFKMRAKNLYVPLKVHVEGDSESGYTKVVDGFSEGLIGMKVGETRTIVVPPDKGYGYGDKTLIKTLPLVETIRMRETWSNAQFKLYFDTSPEVGMLVKNPIYQWPMQVEVVLNNSVVVANEPVPGEEYTVVPGGWNVKVISVDSSADHGNGTIIVRHMLSSDDVFRIKGTLKDNPTAEIFLKRQYLSDYEQALSIGLPHGKDSVAKTFLLSDVNETAGTFTIDYNDVTKGRTLVFWVKLVSIDEW